MDGNAVVEFTGIYLCCAEVIIGVYLICFHDRWKAASRRRRRLPR